MPRLRMPSYALLATLFLYTSTTALSHPSLFVRQESTCAAAGFNKCPQAGLPSNFCCPSDKTCIPLAGNTTVLCCPNGSSCTVIAPIICDLSAQDVDKNPDNTLKTTALTGTLGKCGSACCPFGYTCNAQGNCAKDANQNISPVPQQSTSASQTPSSTSAPTATSSTAPTTTSSNSPNSSPNTTDIPAVSETSSPKFPASAVLLGFFPGIILGILLTLLSICLIGQRKRSKAAKGSTSKRQSGSSFGNISEPQLQSDLRTDFLRKAPQTPSTLVGGAGTTPRRQPTLKRVKSLFRRSGNSNSGIGELADYQERATGQRNSGYGSGMGYPPPPPIIPLMIQKQKQKQAKKELQQKDINHALGLGLGTYSSYNPPVTPPLQREPSYENINIFADGDTASALRGIQNGEGNTRQSSGAHGGLAPPIHFTNDSGAVRASHQTTFSDLLERSVQSGDGSLARLQKGQPFVYKGNSPVYTPSPPNGRAVGVAGKISF